MEQSSGTMTESEHPHETAENDVFINDLQYSLEKSSLDVLRNSILCAMDISKYQKPMVPIINELNPSSLGSDCSYLRKSALKISKEFDKNLLSFSSQISTQSTTAETSEATSEQTQHCDVRNDTDSGILNELNDLHDLETSNEHDYEKEFYVKDEGIHAIQSVENENLEKHSLKLACRTPSNIFEDCSTYNITYPNLHNPKENSLTNEINHLSLSTNNNLTHVVDSPRISNYFTNQSYVRTISKVSDDQNVLSDTFFSNVINGDYEKIVPSSPNQAKSSIFKLQNELKANSNSTNSIVSSNDSSHKSKDNKRSRKRNRRSKLKLPFQYECSKCGVSYVIPSKPADDIIRCLHCDLCTSVEPVFLKKDKLMWNSCRIC